MWALSRNSVCGSVTTALAMLASPGRAVTVACSAGFPDLLVDPESRRPSFGPNGSVPQFATWKWLLREASDPWSPRMSALTESGSQWVGLRAKSGRSRLTRIERSLRGIPSMIEGRRIGDRP